MKSLKKAVFMVLTALSLVSAATVMADNITMYAPDGRTETVEEGNVQSWSDSGWYTYPVMNVYAPDDRVCVIAKRDLTDWQNSGWYAYPVMNIYSVYNSFPIAKSDLAYWQEQGWYAYPVMNVYAPNGQVCVIAKSDLADWQKMGWYADADNNGYNNNTNNQYNQTTNYSSAYQKLASQIMEKGTKSGTNYGIWASDQMVIGLIIDQNDPFIGFRFKYKNGGNADLFIGENGIIFVSDRNAKGEYNFLGTYDSSMQISFSTLSWTRQDTMDLLKSFYKLCDAYLVNLGIDVKISDFGIAY